MINLYDNESSYLPSEFRYYGYKKIKGGKGYRNGKPIGIIDGPCAEEYILYKQFTYLGKQYNYTIPYQCTGNIISLQMNTSSKGFETTSEKVCDKCGKVTLGSFIVIDKAITNDLTIITRWDTHDAWLKDMQKESTIHINHEGISTETETYQHITGKRLNTDDNHYYGTPGNNDVMGGMNKKKGIQNSKIDDKLHEELGLKSKIMLGVRCDQWNRGTEERTKLIENGYNDLVDIYKSELDLTPGQVEEVKYVLKNRGSDFDTRYKMDDIIFHICLFEKRKKTDGRKLGRKLQLLKSSGRYSEQLYTLIKQKMDKQTK